MLGAIIGDIVGSRFEWNNHKGKDFELFTDQCQFTDDSAMTPGITMPLQRKEISLKSLATGCILHIYMTMTVF